MPAPKDFDDMWRELRGMLPKLRTLIRNPFANTGLSIPTAGTVVVEQVFTIQDGALSQVDPGGDLDINGNANVDGTLNVGGPAQFGGDVEVVGGRVFANYSPGVSGWQISGDGSAEFNDLTVRVSNDSLDSPLLPKSLPKALILAPIITTTAASFGDTSVASPTSGGYDRESIIASGRIYGQNLTGSTVTGEVFLLVRHASGADERIAGTPFTIANGAFYNIPVSGADVIDVSTPGTTVLSIWASASATLTPDAGEVVGTAFFSVT